MVIYNETVDSLNECKIEQNFIRYDKTIMIDGKAYRNKQNEEQEMRVQLKELEYCKVEASYWADSDVIEEKRTEAIEALRKVQIPGFRANKAPDYAIKARCKKQINDWVAREMAHHAYDDVIFETNIKPIGMPQFKEIDIKGNKYFCKMELLKKPEFVLCDYEALEIPKPDINRDIVGMTEGSLHSLRVKLGEHVPFDENDVVANGDKVTMTSEATIDGEKFEEGSFEGLLYRVGEDKFPEFDEFLIGMKAEEEREFELVLPEEVADFGGKTAKFKVTIHMGMKLKPHELNDEFLEKCGKKSLEELKDDLKRITTARVKDTEKLWVKNQIIKQLLAKHDFEIPKFLLDNEIKSLMSQYKIDEKALNEGEKEELKTKAINSLKLTLVLDSIKNEEPEALMSDHEAQQVIVNNLQSQGQDAKKFLETNRGMVAHMIASIKDEFVLDWLASKVKIIE